MRSTKRRKTDPESPVKSQVGKGRPSESDLHILPNRRVSKPSLSEPVTRISSPLFEPTHSRSQPSGSGCRLEQSSSSPTEHRSASRSSSNCVPRDSPVLDISDNYDSWEQGVSAEDLKEVQEELQNHSGMVYHLYPRCRVLKHR